MIGVLRTPGAAYLVVTAMIGRLPSGMSVVALVRLVLDQGGDYGLASLVTSSYVVAGTVGQPALSRIVDRTGRARLVLLGSAAAATAAFVGLAYTAVTRPAVGVLLALVAGFATPPLESVLRTLWVRLVGSGPRLHEAFSLDAAAQEIMYISAPLITALGIAVFGARGNVLFMAAVGLVGAAAFAAHARLARSTPLSDGGGHGRTPLALAGFRRLVLALVCAGLPIGVVIITSAAFGQEIGRPDFGAWALALNACGSLTGAILVARFPFSGPPFSSPPHRVIRWVIAGLAVLYLPTAWSTAPWPLWLGFAYLGGLPLPPLLTQVFAESARLVPERLLNEANAWVVSAFTVGVSAGSLVAGLVIEAAPSVTRGITLGVATGSVVALAGAALARPTALDRPADRGPDDHPADHPA